MAYESHLKIAIADHIHLPGMVVKKGSVG